MNFTSSRGGGEAEHMTASTQEQMYCMHCAHCQEREATGSYNKEGDGVRSHGGASEATGKKEVSDRVKDLDEDKKTIPVFRRTSKGLKHMYNK